jgi:hypothetical protein
MLPAAREMRIVSPDTAECATTDVALTPAIWTADATISRGRLMSMSLVDGRAGVRGRFGMHSTINEYTFIFDT